MIRALLLRIADACCRALPSMWARAARAEAEHISGTGALARWTLGLVRLALPPWQFFAAVLGTSAAVAWVDLQVEATGTSLAFLLLAAAATGAATRRPLLAGVVLGGAIGAAHVAYVLAGWNLPAGHPSTPLGALALALLVLPAVLAASVGARLRRSS